MFDAVTILGYKYPLNKIKLNRIIREHTNQSLASAKYDVDKIIDGTQIQYTFDNTENAWKFCQDLHNLGIKFSKYK
jgi:hypothetical protein